MSKLKKNLCLVLLEDYYDHSLHEHTSLKSSKWLIILNFMRYHGASIKNTYYY